MRRDVLWTAVAIVAGCGGGMSSSGTTGATVTTTSTPSNTTGGAPSPAPTGAPSTPMPAGFVITIQNMGFSPADLAVPAGATVTVVNLDGTPHSVTSEAIAGSFTPGAPRGLTPFDTGAFSSGQKTFTVAAGAPAGTVFPYYCTVHTSTMTPPNGAITIDPNAKPVATSTQAPTTTGMPMPMPMPYGGGG